MCKYHANRFQRSATRAAPATGGQNPDVHRNQATRPRKICRTISDDFCGVLPFLQGQRHAGAVYRSVPSRSIQTTTRTRASARQAST